MVGFASVWVEESLKTINERRFEVKGVESAKRVVELGFMKCFCEERGLYSGRQNF